MTYQTPDVADHTYNPIDSLVDWMKEQDWSHSRSADNELLVDVRGEVATYSVCYQWHAGMELITFVCGFPYEPPKKIHRQVDKLILRINECLPIGHFERRTEEEAIYFRCSSFFPNGGISDDQAHRLLQEGLGACDRYYPAFTMVSHSIPAEQAFNQGKMLSETEGGMQ